MTTPQPASAPFVAKQGSIYRAGVHLADCAYPIIATRWAAILNAHAGLVAAMYGVLAQCANEEGDPWQDVIDRIEPTVKAALAEVPHD